MQNSQITTEMEASDWLKLSELAGARANAGAAAAERIKSMFLASAPTHFTNNATYDPAP
jgi:hypothetical protein